MTSEDETFFSGEFLVTGGAGFIGYEFVNELLANPSWASYSIKVLDAITYAANPEHVKALIANPRVEFIQVDIADMSALRPAFGTPDFVVNFAAETHVDNSLSYPGKFAKTNVLGTTNLLELSVKAQVKRFLQVSTDEVYGSIPSGAASETSPLNPSSPYSASKAAADLMTLAFHKSFGLDCVITRCSNNYGTSQHPEKLIPTILRSLEKGLPVPLYGSGENLREWIDVRDHVHGVLDCITKGRAGEIYNLGSGEILSNLQVVGIAATNYPLVESTHKSVEDRPGHDFRYALDSSKAEIELGFTPTGSLEAFFSERARGRGE